MKTLKTAVLTGMLALGLASMASAATYVRLTGSTAFRGATHKAICNIAWDARPTCTTNNSDLTAASKTIFHGFISGNEYYIKCSWTGSEFGIQSVGAQLPMPSSTSDYRFMDDAEVNTYGTPIATDMTGAALRGSPSTTDATAPDVAMSDTYQSTSQFYAGASKTLTTGTTVTIAQLYDATVSGTVAGPVGIVPFKFLANKGTTKITNITTMQAQNLFANGVVSLSVFTGNAADSGTGGTTGNSNWVYAVGRNPDSGTRLSTFAEIGLGATATAYNYDMQTSGGAEISAAGSTIGKLAKYAGAQVNYLNVGLGNNGYNSGGNLCKGLNSTLSSNISGSERTGASTKYCGAIIGYAGTGDCDPQIDFVSNTKAVELSYNGVKLGQGNSSIDYNNANVILNGQYTFWGYEHMYLRNSYTDANVKTFANLVAARIYSNDAVVLLGNMKVSRSTDGAVVK